MEEEIKQSHDTNELIIQKSSLEYTLKNLTEEVEILS